jgi:catechol 2,3-dioxygenase-like lactoylglutathione lyase family enzyme
MKIDSNLKQTLSLVEVSQIGLVVKDIEATKRRYLEMFGIDFPKVFIPEYFKMTYRGKPADFKFKVALGMMGEMQIELIEVLRGETIYGEFLEQKGEGLHHLGFDVKNMDERIEALEKLGIGVLQSGERIGARFAYMDTEKTVGLIVEFIEREKKI